MDDGDEPFFKGQDYYIHIRAQVTCVPAQFPAYQLSGLQTFVSGAKKHHRIQVDYQRQHDRSLTNIAGTGKSKQVKSGYTFFRSLFSDHSTQRVYRQGTNLVLMPPKVWATSKGGLIATGIEAGVIDGVIMLRGGRTIVHAVEMLRRTTRGVRLRATHQVFAFPMFLGIRLRHTQEAEMGVAGVGLRIADGTLPHQGWLEGAALMEMMELSGLILANGRRSK